MHSNFLVKDFCTFGGYVVEGWRTGFMVRASADTPPCQAGESRTSEREQTGGELVLGYQGGLVPEVRDLLTFRHLDLQVDPLLLVLAARHVLRID